MVYLKYAVILLIVCVSFSILFFIPSERTGFVAQVKPPERVLLGYLFAFIGLFVLLIPITQKRSKTHEQLLYAWQNDPKGFVYSVMEETGLKPTEKISREGISTIIDTLGKKYRLSQDMQLDLEVYLGNKFRELKGNMTPYEVLQDCIAEVYNRYGRKRTVKGKWKGKWFQK